MISLVELAHRTEITARFRRTLLIFWLPLVLAAVVPAIVTAVATWFESPTSLQSPHVSIPILIVALTVVVGLAVYALRNLLARGAHPPPTSSAKADDASTNTATPAMPAANNNWAWARRIEADERIADAALRKEAARIDALKQEG